MNSLLVLLLALEAAASKYQYKCVTSEFPDKGDNQLGFTVTHSLSYCCDGRRKENVLASIDHVSMFPVNPNTKLSENNSGNNTNIGSNIEMSSTNNLNFEINQNSNKNNNTSTIDTSISIYMEEGKLGKFIKYKRPKGNQSQIFLVRGGTIILQSILNRVEGMIPVRSGDSLLVLFSGLSPLKPMLIPKGRLVKKFFYSLSKQLPEDTELIAVLIEISNTIQKLYERPVYEELFTLKKRMSGLVLDVPYLRCPRLVNDDSPSLQVDDTITQGRYFKAHRTWFTMDYMSSPVLNVCDSNLTVSINGNYLRVKQSGPRPFLFGYLSKAKGDKLSTGITFNFVQRIQEGDSLIIYRELSCDYSTFESKILISRGKDKWLDQIEELDAEIEKGNALVINIVQGNMSAFLRGLRLPKRIHLSKGKHVTTDSKAKVKQNHPQDISFITGHLSKLILEDQEPPQSTFGDQSPSSKDNLF